MDQSRKSDTGISESVNEIELTMVDILKEEEQLEDDAAAVLGAGDDSSCTYDQGYMNRQAIYACQTCLPSDKEVGGICLGCSYHCHEGHDLIELYTKRNFRCDCGNSKYPGSNPCKYIKDKLPVNPENAYNQNFHGNYCSCNRPYPDLESTVEDQMIQCIICEDWYHGRHLDVADVPADDEFSEMICGNCFPKFDFLQNYLGLSVTVISAKDTSSALVDIAMEAEKDENNVLSSVTDLGNKITSCEEEQNGSKRQENCKLLNLKKLVYASGAVFFRIDWRNELCTCLSCQDMYSKLKAAFLVDPEDTVCYYESKGREKRQSERGVQREIDALSTLDRITRTEVVHEYNNLSSSLREYLKKFADNGKVVRDEDIKEFFSELKANKKQRKDRGMQFFCK